MKLNERLRSANGDLKKTFEILLPGKTKGMDKLRADILALCADPLARGALMFGAPGVGKSTVARVIALGRYLHAITEERARDFLEWIKTDAPGRIDIKQLPWLTEFSVPGLMESVANSQLFGYVKSMTSGANEESSGLFRIAARGDETLGTEPHAGNLITSGVVFLDEIGDLSPSLQPKLLSVLTRAPIYPVGADASKEREFIFHGLVIAATWKDLSDEKVFRPDLRARLSDHVLHVPSLSDRLDDLDLLIENIVQELRVEYDQWLSRMVKEAAGSGIDLPRFEKEKKRIEGLEISKEDLELLRKVDWQHRNELRGLTQLLRNHVLNSVPIGDLIERGHSDPVLERNAMTLLNQLLNAPPPSPGTTIIKAVGHEVKRLRAELADLLQSDPEAMRKLAHVFGTHIKTFRKQVSELRR